MTRPDLNPSDLAGLEMNAYGKRCPDRQFAALERQHAEVEPPSGAETVAVCVSVLIGAGAVVAVIMEFVKWI